eukprot:PITA_11456
MKNGVWEIIPRSSDKSVVTSKWIYKIKQVVDGSIDIYKVRFVTRGFSQKEGIDYEETFAPTARYTTITSLVSLATTMGWNIHQMDVKEPFLNGTIDEELCIEQSESFEINSRDTHVCKLKKAIYGLKKILATTFEMKDLGLMHYYLGLEVWQKPSEIYLGQGKYIIKMLQMFGMMYSKPMTTSMVTNLKMLRSSDSSLVDPTRYSKLVGSLMYLQGPVALSSAEAEYVATCEVGKEVVWLRKLLSDLFGKPLDPTVINCNNQSSIKMSEDPVFNARMKHINDKYHYIRSLVQDGVVKLQYIPTYEHVTNVFTVDEISSEEEV